MYHGIQHLKVSPKFKLPELIWGIGEVLLSSSSTLFPSENMLNDVSLYVTLTIATSLYYLLRHTNIAPLSLSVCVLPSVAYTVDCLSAATPPFIFLSTES